MEVTASRPVIEVRYGAYRKTNSGTAVAPTGHAKVGREVNLNAWPPIEVTASRPVIEER
jgi:hypothetical protein